VAPFKRARAIALKAGEIQSYVLNVVPTRGIKIKTAIVIIANLNHKLKITLP
jgi:hypothetical protein